jgi:drug/metabolite transporter (DMT)-like permease
MKGYLYTISSAFVYASQVILGKYILTGGTDAWVLSFLQVAIGAVLMFGAGLLKMPDGFRAKFFIKKQDIIWVILLGVIGGCAMNLMLNFTLQRVDAGIGSMLLFLHPVLICLFFLISGVRKLTLINKISLAMVVVGSVLVLNIFGASHSWTGVGIVCGLLTCLFCACFFLILDLKLSQYPTTIIFFYDWLIASVTILILKPSVIPEIPNLSINTFLLIVFVSSVTTVLPSFLLGKGVVLIGSERSTVVGTLELPLTVLLAYLFLSEVMVPIQLLGIFLVVSAVAALSIEGSKSGPLERTKRRIQDE